jgi:hypothetical protein
MASHNLPKDPFASRIIAHDLADAMERMIERASQPKRETDGCKAPVGERNG